MKVKILTTVPKQYLDCTSVKVFFFTFTQLKLIFSGPLLIEHIEIKKA